MQKSTRSSSAWRGADGGKPASARARRRAVLGRARQAVAQRAVALEQLDRVAEVALALLDLLERAAPEAALLGAAARERQHHRQGDLAVAEVVAQALAEHHLARAVVEHVVGQLERDAEVLAIARAAPRPRPAGRSATRAPICAAAANSVAVLPRTTRR